MQAMDDMALLREYATSNSETAFETLVSRRAGFVYSAALRQVRDPLLAGEITQAVFIILAQKAGLISNKTILTGWLFKTTRFTALAHQRATAKRRQREQEAHMQSETQLPPDPLWEQMSPLLDEAIAQLGEADRQAVLLRYFENKSLLEVGSELGTGEDTARKRVSRALEKLRRYFSRRGVVSTTVIIAGAISANSVQAAPAGLAQAAAVAAVAKGTTAAGSTLALIKGALKIMAWANLKTSIVVGSALVLAAGTTTVAVHEKHVRELDQRYFANINNAPLNLLIIRPTQFGPPVPPVITSSSEGGGKTFHMIARNLSFQSVIASAYGWGPMYSTYLKSRTIYPEGLPTNEFDVFVTAPNGQAEFQAEIERQFGVVAHQETQNRKVFLLRVANPDVIAQKVSAQTNDFEMIAGKYHAARTIPHFIMQWEINLQTPLIDETGLTNRYSDIGEWHSMTASNASYFTNTPLVQKDMLEQLGLELVPTNRPVEMLVVEKGLPHTDSGDLEGRNLLKQSQAKYASIPSYADVTRTVQNIDGKTLMTTANVRLGRPNLYRIDWAQTNLSLFTNRGLIWSAGDGDFFRNEMSQKTTKIPFPAEGLENALAMGSDVSGGATTMVPEIFFQRPAIPARAGWSEVLEALVSDTAKFTRLKDETVGGVDCSVVSAATGKSTVQVWIGKQDLLIRQTRQILNGLDAGSAATQTHENISVTNQFQNSDFSQ